MGFFQMISLSSILRVRNYFQTIHKYNETNKIKLELFNWRMSIIFETYHKFERKKSVSQLK